MSNALKLSVIAIVGLLAVACGSPTGPSPTESRLQVENARLEAEVATYKIIVDTLQKASQ